MRTYRVLKVSIPDRVNETGCVEHFDAYDRYLVQNKILWLFWNTMAIFQTQQDGIDHIHRLGKEKKEQTYIINV